jgi:glycolate oxidase iron-sulfur subunit
VSAAKLPLADVRAAVLRCCRCGQCRSVCPTFAELHDEANAPRGRLTTVAALQEGRLVSTEDLAQSINQCTMCLSCAAECPSAVDLGGIYLAARKELADRLGVGGVKGAALSMVARGNRFLPSAAKLMWAGQGLPFRHVPANSGLRLRFPMGSMDRDRMLPSFARTPLRQSLPTISGNPGAKSRVAYFTGCFDNFFDPQVGRDVVSVLVRNGYQVLIPPGQGCCALPMITNGLRDVALDLMRQNVAALTEANPDAIVVACASCGSALKEMYARTFESAGDAASAERARLMAAKTYDVCQFLADRGFEPPTRPVEQQVTYHDPCHLVRGLGVRAEPRAILASIPGLTLTEHKEADRCCGGGGTFGFSHRGLSKRIQERKLSNIAASGAGVIATGCPGCKYQLNDGLQRLGMSQRVVHTVQLLARGYGAE